MRRALALLLVVAMIGPFSTSAQTHDFEAGQTVVVSFPSKPMRMDPSTNSQVVATVVQGDRLTIIDIDPVQSDGLTWWHLKTADGSKSGWLPDSVFTAVPEGANAPVSCWTDEQTAMVAGATAWTAPPAMVIDQQATYLATMTTTAGTIVLQLDAAQAPIATNNFICLADAGYYDGTDFHRVSSDFLIQGGDATGTGTGSPGYTVPSDPTTGNYPAGSIALANAKPDENGAQFFIAVTDLTGKIPSDYPVFGEVISGQEVVAEISHAAVEPNPRGEVSQPIDPTTIESIEIAQKEDEVGPPLPGEATTPAATPSATATPDVAPTVALPPTEVIVIELDAKDIAFVPTEITINAADEPVTIRMKNTGAAPHDFSIDALKISIAANPGETVDIVIPAGTAPGTYDFYCNVPGHKEAGMTGTLTIVGPSASTGAVESGRSCQGFATYTSQYDQAFFDSFDANPAAVSIFDSYEDSDSWLLLLSPGELSTLADLTSDVAANLRLVRPPAFALEWHRLQIESIQLFSGFFESAAVIGVTMASITLDAQGTQLMGETRAVLEKADSCDEFVTWAIDESALLDDELGPVSSAFSPGVASGEISR